MADSRCWLIGPRPAARRSGACHDDFDADDVVVEVNFGGDMATEVVKQAAERSVGAQVQNNAQAPTSVASPNNAPAAASQ